MSQTAAGSSRWNNASGANVNRDVVFGEGSFKRVYKGKYDGGQRAGEACVVKEMRSGPTWLNSVFDSEIEVVNRAVEIIERFNNAGHIDKRILMNRPAVWLYTTSCGANIAGSAVLVEPFISNYQKFNSNSGWVSPVQQKWNQVMQVRVYKDARLWLQHLSSATMAANHPDLSWFKNAGTEPFLIPLQLRPVCVV